MTYIGKRTNLTQTDLIAAARYCNADELVVDCDNCPISLLGKYDDYDDNCDELVIKDLFDLLDALIGEAQ